MKFSLWDMWVNTLLLLKKGKKALKTMLAPKHDGTDTDTFL